MFRHWARSSKKPRRRADDQGRLKGREAQSGSSTREEGSKKRGRRRAGKCFTFQEKLGRNEGESQGS